MKTLLAGFFAVAVALFGPSIAFAQQAACPIALEAPVLVTGTTYTLSAADGCKMLVFSNAGAVALTMPNAAVTLPNGWKVWIKSQGAGGVFATPTTSTLDGGAGAINITQGLGVEFRSDGVNYYSTGLGKKNP